MREKEFEKEQKEEHEAMVSNIIEALERLPRETKDEYMKVLISRSLAFQPMIAAHEGKFHKFKIDPDNYLREIGAFGLSAVKTYEKMVTKEEDALLRGGI